MIPPSTPPGVADTIAPPELRDEGTMMAVGRTGLHRDEDAPPEPGQGRRVRTADEPGDGRPPEA